MPKKSGGDPEIAAISDVYDALKELDDSAQTRVIEYVVRKLNLTLPGRGRSSPPSPDSEVEQDVRREEVTDDEPTVTDPSEADEDLDGISSVAKKWMRRHGLLADKLSSVFSLGVDEIDLIAVKVPGDNKKERMRSVFLLKGVAAYLGTGAARFKDQPTREGCTHYDAYDAHNFSKYFKSFASEVSGSNETGYALTPRGLSSATEMIKTMVAASTAVGRAG